MIFFITFAVGLSLVNFVAICVLGKTLRKLDKQRENLSDAFSNKVLTQIEEVQYIKRVLDHQGLDLSGKIKRASEGYPGNIVEGFPQHEGQIPKALAAINEKLNARRDTLLEAAKAIADDKRQIQILSERHNVTDDEISAICKWLKIEIVSPSSLIMARKIEGEKR